MHNRPLAVAWLLAVLGTVVVFGEPRIPSSTHDFSTSQDITFSFPEGGGNAPAGAEVASEQSPSGDGPAARLRTFGFDEPGASLPSHSGRPAGSVSTNIRCDFSAWDEYEYLWDFTYEARIFDPNDNQIKYGGGWAYEKTGMNAVVDVDVTDPIEGVYRCTVHWWIGTYFEINEQTTRNLSYSVPSDEYSVHAGWEVDTNRATQARWTGLLTPGSFKGRVVTEATAYSYTDGCKASVAGGGVIPTFNTVSGYSWDVIDGGSYGIDTIGWPEAAVSLYRSTATLPCETNFGQAMYINRPGNLAVQYKVNAIRAQISANSVLVERGGSSATRSY